MGSGEGLFFLNKTNNKIITINYHDAEIESEYEICMNINNHYSFKLKTSSGEIIYTHEKSFNSKEECLEAIELLRINSALAKIV
jgi:uncharacterized protein YegP (UPF0339 family)